MRRSRTIIALVISALVPFDLSAQTRATDRAAEAPAGLEDAIVAAVAAIRQGAEDRRLGFEMSHETVLPAQVSENVARRLGYRRSKFGSRPDSVDHYFRIDNWSQDSARVTLYVKRITVRGTRISKDTQIVTMEHQGPRWVMVGRRRVGVI